MPPNRKLRFLDVGSLVYLISIASKLVKTEKFIRSLASSWN